MGSIADRTWTRSGKFRACFASTKERMRLPQAEPDIKAELASLLHNGPWFALFFSAVFALTNVAIRGGATLFFMKYYVGDDGAPLFSALGLDFSKTAMLLSSGTLALLCGILAAQMVLRHFDKRKLMIALTLANAVIIRGLLLHTDRPASVVTASLF